MVIGSVNNPKIKKYLTLSNKRGRDEEKLFIVENEHLCSEASKKERLVDILVEEGYELSFEPNCEITYVKDNVLKKLSNLVNYPKVLGICTIIDSQEIKGDGILMLDNVQDPGNLGTIIRSCAAFNVKTIVLSEDCVDLYNDKVIRSTQGLLFNVNIIRADLLELIPVLQKKKYKILGTNVHNGVDVRGVNPQKYVLIMGNEGHGVRKEIQDLCDKNLNIKMNRNCESLNVGVATSILIYELNNR